MSLEVVGVEQPTRASGAPLQPIIIALAPFLLLLIAVLWETDGNFTYSMDDPYIALTLARNIWHGHYDINPGEPTAPASSILWSFLIAPFSVLGDYFEYVPLVLNLFCLIGSAIVLDSTLSELEPRWRGMLSFLILFSLNVYGVIFAGIEHSLQLLLVLVVLRALLGTERGPKKRSLSRWTLASLIALPLVRYEDLAIALPASLYFYARGERQFATISVVAIILSVGLFSLFVYSLGLGVILPLSVLLKTSPGSLSYTFQNLLSNVGQYGFVLLPAACLLHYYKSRDRNLAAVLVAVTALHFLFGHYGWVGRYEIYYLLFLVVILVRVVAMDLRSSVLTPALLLPCCFPSLVGTTLTTPLGAANIYHQQAQMASIAHMLGEPIAVNDLGLVSFRSGQYVLDLGGLASIEAFRAQRAQLDGALWVGDLMKQHDVHYASIYDSWFPSLPSSLQKVGSLRLLETRITPADSTVTFYATSSQAADHLRTTLQEFAAHVRSNKFDVVTYPDNGGNRPR